MAVLVPATGCSEDNPASAAGGFGGTAAAGAPTGGTLNTGGTTGGFVSTGGTTGTGGIIGTGGTTGGVVGTGGSTGGAAVGGSGGGGRSGAGGGRPSGGIGGGTAGGAITGGAGTATGGGGGDVIPATFQTVKDIIQSNEGACLGVACHTDPTNPLDLRVNDGLYMRLTTVVSKACMNNPIVKPGVPAESALVMMLKGPCGETPRMPYDCKDSTGTCLPADWIAAVEQWIAMGAQQ